MDVHNINIYAATSAAARIAGRAKTVHKKTGFKPGACVTVKIDPEDAYTVYVYLERLKNEKP